MSVGLGEGIILMILGMIIMWGGSILSDKIFLGIMRLRLNYSKQDILERTKDVERNIEAEKRAIERNQNLKKEIKKLL